MENIFAACLKRICGDNLCISGHRMACLIGAKFPTSAYTRSPLSPWSSWAKLLHYQASVCVFEVTSEPAEVTSHSQRLLLGWDLAWVLIPGWVTLRWVMLCNLVPCSVWGLLILWTTMHTSNNYILQHMFERNVQCVCVCMCVCVYVCMCVFTKYIF